MRKPLSLSASNTYSEAVIGASAVPCVKFDYDKSFWKRTIIQEWDLVCDREGLQKLTQQCTFFGLLCGVFASGLLSDRFGRVRTMMALLTTLIISGTATAFAPMYELFLVGIWFCGFTSIGYGTVMYCWMMELIAGKQKTILGCAPHFNYAFWGLAVAGIAYLIPNWHQMELLFTLPLIVLFVTYWVIPESPRWLLINDRAEEAERIVRTIARHNGKPLPQEFKLRSPHHHKDGEHVKGKGFLGFLELFKTPNLRMKTLIIYYMWFSTSVVYYGLTLNSNDLGGSIFAYFSVGKAMEFPAIALTMFLLLKAGRRVALILFYGVGAIALLLTMAVPASSDYDWLIFTLNIVGRFCASGTLTVCYVYSAEIFPTVIRNVGIGSSSVWARIGPMIAPYIKDLAVYDQRLPIVVFGLIALLASFLVTFLPETADHKLPDTIEEGESLGKGDTLYSQIARRIKKGKTQVTHL